MFFQHLSQGSLVIPSEAPRGALWLSGKVFASNPVALKHNEIKAVLSAAKLGIQFGEGVENLVMDLQDDQSQQISRCFDQSNDFIQQKLQHTNVLVHCMAGVSRSVTLVLAFLMARRKMSLDEALKLVLQKRPIAEPNGGFMEQLKDYQKRLAR